MADNYVKVQEDIASKIKKSQINFKKSPKERITKSYIETRLESLESNWTVFSQNHRKIVYELRKEDLEKSIYHTGDIYDQTEELYFEYKTLLKETLLRYSADNIVEPVNIASEKPSVSLPKITLPKFSGRYTEWVSFRDLFTSLVHKNPGIDDVQKLHYLKSSVTGEAEQLLRHIPITSDNYQVCWEQLESRYNNKRFLANNILKRLTSQRALVSESAGAIKQLLDTTKECLHALENIGVKTSDWDIIIIFLITQKLDPESRKQWEQRVSDSVQDLPSLNQFEEFLQSRFRSLEFLDTRVQRVEKANCTHVATTLVACAFCTLNHKLFNCKKFSKESVDARRVDSVEKKHHSLLHPKNPKSASDPKSVTADESVKEAERVTPNLPLTSGEQSIPQVVTCVSNMLGQVLLATALVKVECPKTKSTFVLRSLLDQGSQASFITESAVQMLALKRTPGASLVSGLGSDQATLASKSFVFIKIQSRLDPSFTITVKAHVLSRLTTFLPSSKVVVQVLPALPSNMLADPTFDMPNKIDLLLGAEVYSQILMEGIIRGPSNSIVAQRTRLGWVLSGRIPSHKGEVTGSETCMNVVSLHTMQTNENEILKRFWELESEPSLGMCNRLSQEEQRCEEFFTKSTRRDETGRYVVRLPFKREHPLCLRGNLKDIANKRFLFLEKRLLKDPELKVAYSKVINEYISSGHMEAVSSNELAKKSVYLPHHAVVRHDKTTTKVRMVVDASCTDSNGVSLNNELMVGPTLQPELRHIVMRWRCYPIALVADIVKMYRQIRVADEDLDFQRIFWRESPDAELQHLRFLRVTFGTSSAPYLAVRCLQQLAHDEGSKFPLAVPKVLYEFYMDDLMSGCYTVAEGVQIYDQMTALLKRGGFPLQKWSSNSVDLLNKIQTDTKESNNSLVLKTDEVIKILGLKWNRDTDEFQCTVDLPPLQALVTKRIMISDIARLFDPLVMDADQWSHVASKENPADPASRGLMPSECVTNQLWHQGPDWLWFDVINYERNITDTTLEERKPKIKTYMTAANNEEDNLLSKYSSLKKLTRVVSFCRRVLHWKEPKEKRKKISTQLTAREINESLLSCIKMCQRRSFSEDIGDLERKRKLKKTSKLTSLNPFLDTYQILRVGGRLQRANVDKDTRHPIILPHKSAFTNLIIDEAHSKTMHGGPQIMLNYLRSRYWIIGAKSLVRQFVRRCVTCIRYSAQTSQQMMGQLPSSRVTPHRPFHKSGVDYAGPIQVRPTKGRGYRSTKGYICLFVCMATKALHLEVVSDMTAQSFLAAFKRFVARRGHVSDLWSDNGTNFVGSAKELTKLFSAERSVVVAEIQDWMSSNGTNWHFIPPHSPNFGGLWEAGIKSAKYHLKRVIGDSTLTFEELTTTLSQIEACLNSRPICQISNNPDDPNPLTPGHFLVGEPLVLVPDMNYETSNISALSRWNLTQRMVQDFWRRWSQEYLTQLHHRYKWSDQVPEPDVGSVVLVKEDDLPPARWLLGIITDKHPGLDGLTRVVTLKYKGNIIKRPVSKLVLLPKDCV
ncbi:unnamed protein product [Parnassius mnemosyne]|uniref:Integrase catalytic domain-containing protein n=1 Tax=Parnassius mnemosyne TaxID=213953 RepID=A0AAV1L201_9NEOP